MTYFVSRKSNTTIDIILTSMDFLLTFSVIPAVVDVVSDVALAVDYCVTDNLIWCRLTWGFITLPFVVAIIFVIPAVRQTENIKTFDERVETFQLWKIIQVCFESGPQVLLQVYITSRSTSGNTSFYW